MYSSQPFSCLPLKCVISQCEVNFRFNLANRIPAIRILDKLSPLKVDFLNFHSYGFKVNETDYSFSIVKVHPKIQEKGGILESFCHDLDEFGCYNHLTNKQVLPGDVVLLPNIENDDEFDEERRLEEGLENALREKERLAKNNGKNYISLHLISREIKCFQNLLKPYSNRRKNIRPEYKMFIRLTITTANGKRTSQLIKYNISMFEAIKNLSINIFGGRKYGIQVNKLGLNNSPNIIRLPEGLKLDIKELHLYDKIYETAKAIQPLLVESCIPLKKLHINRCSLITENYNHPIIRSAQEVALGFGIFDLTKSLDVSSYKFETLYE